MQMQIDEIKMAVTANRVAININTVNFAKIRGFAVTLLDFAISTSKPIAIFDPFIKPLEEYKKEL